MPDSMYSEQRFAGSILFVKLYAVQL